jgi:hypothetical protein
MKQIAAILSLSALLYGAPALASINCTGQVVSTQIGPDGDFSAELGYARIRICSAVGSVTVYRAAGSTSPVTLSPAMCSTLMSFFMTGEAARQTLTANVDRTDCDMGDGVYPNPYPQSFNFKP